MQKMYAAGMNVVRINMSHASHDEALNIINNVKLIQMDILAVNLLEEKFNIIESSGVLHHMNDPSKGLKSLFPSRLF